jgi:hypothetical protein
MSYPCTEDSFQDQENQFPVITAHHQKWQPQLPTYSVSNSARCENRQRFHSQQINNNEKHSLEMHSMDIQADLPLCSVASATDCSASTANGCLAASTNPAERTPESMQVTALRKKRCPEATDQPDVPTKQRNRKPDSEISKTQLERRRRQEKKLAKRKRYEEACQRRILELDTNGVERSPNPCYECEVRGILCKISPALDSRWKSNRCLECCKSKNRRCDDRQIEKEPAINTSNISAHTEKVLNRKFLVGEDGPYYTKKFIVWFADF